MSLKTYQKTVVGEWESSNVAAYVCVCVVKPLCVSAA